MKAVDQAKEHILAGDIFQVVIGSRIDAEITSTPLDIYRALRRVNPSPYTFYFRYEDACLIGGSPEILGEDDKQSRHLPADRRHPETRPGTRRRSILRTGIDQRSQRTRRTYHAGGFRPQRYRPGLRVPHGQRDRSNVRRTILACHAPRLQRRRRVERGHELLTISCAPRSPPEP